MGTSKRGSVLLCAFFGVWFSRSLPGQDCNSNGVPDSVDIAASTSADCNANGIPDECDLAALRIDFGEPRVFSTVIDSTESPAAVLIDDFDGDDDLDLVVHHAFLSSDGMDTVTLLRNSGDGEFGPPEVVARGLSLSAVVSADLDRDGDLDLVIAFPDQDDRIVRTFTNQGDGKFEASGRFLPGRQTGRLTAADFDNDGDPDLAAADATHVTVLENRNGGDFSLTMFEQELGAETWPDGLPPRARDIDGDGFVDLLVRNHFTNTYWLFRNDRGVFGHPEVLDLIDAFFLLSDLDLDGDGRGDLLMRNTLFFSDGRVVELSREGVARALGDLDGDEDIDLVMKSESAAFLLFNDGAGGFQQLLELPLRGRAELLRAEDLDGDGALDLIALFGSPNEVSVRLQLDVRVPAHPDVNANGVPDSCEPDCLGDEPTDGCGGAGPRFLRGDCNADAGVNLADAICVLARLFQGTAASCEAALDANSDAALNLTDAVFLLDSLFGGGPAPAAPFPDCGFGPAGLHVRLGCDQGPDCL